MTIHLQGYSILRITQINRLCSMEYRTLEGYPYEVYEDGTVWRKEHTTLRGTHLKRVKISTYKAKNCYVVVCLHDRKGERKQFYLHRLVYECFYGKIPNGFEIDHIDGNKENNFRENLRLITHKANCNTATAKARHKVANSLNKGKFNRDKMVAAKGKENDERLKAVYLSITSEKGDCNVWNLMKIGHCGYPRAVRICNEMQGKVKDMGASSN